MIVVAVKFIVAFFFVYGLLFAKTQLQSYIILIGLVLLFLFKRYLQEPSGCQQQQQKQQQQQQEQQEQQQEQSEELVLGTAVILAIARTTAITLKLHDVVF